MSGFTLDIVDMAEPGGPAPMAPTGNPYHIEGPAIVNVSGGRTSGYMLWHILQAHGGALPPDVLPVFQNTGQEREGTLVFLREMAEQWGVTIHWIEYDSHGRGREFCKVVDFESAARRGQRGPFDKLIEDRNYLPNARTRFCTEALKVIPSLQFGRALGFVEQVGDETADVFERVIGVRADEPRRVAKLRADYGDVLLPLATAGVTRAHVDAFWRAQPFQLDLGGEASNCVHCPLRGWRNLVGIEQREPGALAWAAEQERKVSKVDGAAASWSPKWSMGHLVEVADAQPLIRRSDDEPVLVDCLCGPGD